MKTNLTFSINCFSNTVITATLKRVIGTECGLISSQTLKNKATQVSYWVWNTAASKWVRCSTFLSKKELLKTAAILTVERSKEVQINDRGITESGYTANPISCNCPNYGNQHFGLRVNGYAVCKHTLAYAKKYMGVQSFREYVQLRDSVSNEVVLAA